MAWAAFGLIGVAFVAPSLQPAADAPGPPAAPPAFAAAPAAPARHRIGNGFSVHEIARGADGQFYADAQVNGAHVRFMIDTGASIVALTPDDARRAGIALPSQRVLAAGVGGTVEVIPVTIDRITLGPIEARGVPGAVAEALPVSLLGQSFLGQLAGVEIHGDTMVLR